MPINKGVLSSNHKVVDFTSRLLDILLLSMSLHLALIISGKHWNETTIGVLLFGLVYFQLFAALFGIYNSHRSETLQAQYRQLLFVLLGTFILLAFTAYVFNRVEAVISRSRYVWWFSASFVSLTLIRYFYRSLLISIRRHGLNTRCAAIVGSGPLGQTLARKFRENPWMGIRVGGIYDDAPCDQEGVILRGSIEKLVTDACRGDYEHIYIALPLAEQKKVHQLTDRLSDTAASVYFVPDVFVFDLMNSRSHSIDGIPAISIYDTPFTVTDNILKRGFDIVGSAVILMMIAPLMIAIATAVRLTSTGPAIFKQKRYGLDGKAIEVWKFRTMTTMDNGAVVKQATQNDSRLTSIGAFLRRTSLDELPQFVNVLQGSMSIVGPRPHAIAHNEEYRKLIKGYMLRHKVKPGITGWAQINGWRGETDTLEKMEKRIEYDLQYIRNWNIWLDVKIVFMTVFKGFINKNAY